MLYTKITEGGKTMLGKIAIVAVVVVVVAIIAVVVKKNRE